MPTVSTNYYLTVRHICAGKGFLSTGTCFSNLGKCLRKSTLVRVHFKYSNGPTAKSVTKKKYNKRFFWGILKVFITPTLNDISG